MSKSTLLVENLKHGTCYDAELWLDDTYMLLPSNTPISQDLIDRLKQWKFPNILTSGFPISDENLALEESGIVSKATLNYGMHEQELWNQAFQFFQSTVEFTQKIYLTIQKNEYFGMEDLATQVKEIIKMTKEYAPFMVRFHNFHADESPYLFNHAARTVIIAIFIGEELKLPLFRLIELGISAILHEVGMMNIPQSIYEKEGVLTPEEQKQIFSHTVYGYKMLMEYSRGNTRTFPQEILLGVLHHHERSNGSGYPQRLRDDSISLFGKIIGVACSYDAQTTTRHHRKGINSHMVILRMLKELDTLYDKQIVSILFNLVSLYPVGSFVRLGNGSVGIVIEAVKGKPRYPVVKLYMNKNERVYTEQLIVKTMDDPNLKIVEVLDEDTVKDFISRKLIPK